MFNKEVIHAFDMLLEELERIVIDLNPSYYTRLSHFCEVWV